MTVFPQAQRENTCQDPLDIFVDNRDISFVGKTQQRVRYVRAKAFSIKLLEAGQLVRYHRVKLMDDRLGDIQNALCPII